PHLSTLAWLFDDGVRAGRGSSLAELRRRAGEADDQLRRDAAEIARQRKMLATEDARAHLARAEIAKLRAAADHLTAQRPAPRAPGGAARGAPASPTRRATGAAGSPWSSAAGRGASPRRSARSRGSCASADRPVAAQARPCIMAPPIRRPAPPIRCD